MRTLLVATVFTAAAGLGLALTPAAHALETPEQAAAEGFVTQASPPVAGSEAPANADNGLAQRRISQPGPEVTPQAVPAQQ